MTRMPGARWRGPVPNRRPGGMGDVHGLVLHVQQGTEAGTDAWFHNPAAQASSHFGNPKAGPLDQWVDTADAAWAQSDGNGHWISVEHEGHAGDALTDSQLVNDAALMSWLHATYGVPLAVTDDPNGRGLIWHGAGGQAWGGHPDCPGAPIVAARPAILAAAAHLSDLTAPPTDWFAMATQADLVAVLNQYFANGEGNPSTGRIVQADNTSLRPVAAQLAAHTAQIAALATALGHVAAGTPVDLAAVEQAATAGVSAAMANLKVTVS